MNPTIIDEATEQLAEYFGDILADDTIDQPAAMTKLFKQYGDYIKANVNDDVTGDHAGDDDKKLSGKLRQMVAALITSVPGLREDQAMHFLLHSPRGRKLAEHLNNISKGEQMPQLDIMKVIAITEQGLMATVVKRDGERFDTAFARKFENDIDFRKQWRDLTDAKHSMAFGKGMATLTPTSTEVGNTNVSDDSAEAVRLLQEMAATNGRSFESVFADPANRALAARTYTKHHLPGSA
jgi:hypothetical protein